MNQIILFTKIPEKNFGKNRLRKYLSDDKVVSISKKLIGYVYEQIKEYSHCIYYSGDISKLENIHCQAYQQCGKDIGQRMFHAIKAEKKKADKVLLLGSDFAFLPKDIFDDAFEALDTCDIVIAPTKDGGYGLIGMKESIDVFTDINYGADSVLEELLKKAEDLKLTYRLLSPLSDIDEIEDIIRFETGCQDCSLLGMGEYNINFLADDKVFRINTASQMGLGQKQIEYEFLALKALEPCGVTPKVYSYCLKGKLLPYGSLYMEYLEGRSLDYGSDLPVAARLLARVHNQPYLSLHLISSPSPFALMYQEFLTMYSKYRNWTKKDPSVTAVIDRFLEAVRASGLSDEVENPCIINTELNNENFIIGQTSYIIDWEKPIIGECEQDLAHFLVPTTTNWKTEVILSKEQIESFLEEYSKYRSFSRERLKKYMMFNLVRGITWCAMAKVEYSEGRSISKEGTLKKIDKFLSAEFLSLLESRFINHDEKP